MGSKIHTASATVKAGQDDMTARYQSAQLMMQGLINPDCSAVLNEKLLPNWIEDSHCFWYKRRLKNGTEYRLVDAGKATNLPAFNHAMLAEALAEASGEAVDAENLPMNSVNIALQTQSIEFCAFGETWHYSEQSGCTKKTVAPDTPGLVSPDGKHTALVRDNNLWLRILESGEEFPLTQDGEALNAYGAGGSAWGFEWSSSGIGLSEIPEALWSPDGKRLFSLQRDLREVKTNPKIHFLPTDGSLRPQVIQQRYAIPGDEQVGTYRLVVIDIETKTLQEPDYPHLIHADYGGPFFGTGLGWWSKDSKHAYFVEQQRGDHCFNLVEFDTSTGKTRVLITETSETFLEFHPKNEHPAAFHYLPETDELIWFSERTGWGHLYLYDMKTGQLKNAITSGDWPIFWMLKTDAVKRELLLVISGRVKDRDPYYKEVVSVHMDTGKLTPLVSSDHEYFIYPSQVSPNGDYFVATRSRVDDLPVSLLFDRDGQQVLELERADISGLPANWQPPEPIRLKGADAKTDIYGVIFRPSNFDPNKKYPVIEHLFYAAPDTIQVPKGGFSNNLGDSLSWAYSKLSAFAELGFIAVAVDGRGGPFRGKKFKDESYGWAPATSNVHDRVAGIRQMAERYPYMDLERVGITGHRGATGTLYSLLEYPDFYKAAVLPEIHDNRLMTSIWGDRFEGVTPDPEKLKQHYEHHLHKLSAKVLINHGMVDISNPVAGAFRLIDALEKANKDFDMLIMPNQSVFPSCYTLRRIWDWLIKNLMEETPPEMFALTIPGLNEASSDSTINDAAVL